MRIQVGMVPQRSDNCCKSLTIVQSDRNRATAGYAHMEYNDLVVVQRTRRVPDYAAASLRRQREMTLNLPHGVTRCCCCKLSCVTADQPTRRGYSLQTTGSKDMAQTLYEDWTGVAIFGYLYIRNTEDFSWVGSNHLFHAQYASNTITVMGKKKTR